LPQFVAAFAARVYIAGMYLFFPFMPLFASVVFLRSKYVRNYGRTLKQLRVHIEALREGPVQHYFGDVIGKGSEVPVEVHGECVQCGNCCMDRRCMFLEQTSATTYQCGIYHSPFRRMSNCGSFPLNQHDIERYACPSYYVVEAKPVPVRFVRNLGELQSAKWGSQGPV